MLSLRTYPALRSAVRKAIARGKERAFRAVEREKVRTSWEVGKLILDHVLLHRKKGAYGASVMRRLSGDLRISYTEVK